MQREFQAIQRVWSHHWPFEARPLRDVEVVAGQREVPAPRRGREAPHDVLERFDGLLGAVQLLKDEDDWLALRDAGQRASDQLEDGDLVLGLGDACRTGVRRGGPRQPPSRRVDDPSGR